MSNKKLLLALASAVLVLGSCTNSSDGQDEQPKYITVSTEIGSMTRLTTDASGRQAFSDGDEISVYAWTGDPAAPAAGARVVDNAINQLTNQKWTATPQMLWKNMTDLHYFIGIYPKTASPVADLTAGAFTLDASNQEASDLLVAVRNEGLTASQNPVALTFNHVMARLVVNLQFRNQWGGTPTVEAVKVAGMASEATVNYLAQTVKPAASAARADLALPAQKANEQYVSIVIPQDGITTIAVRIGGKDYIYTHPSDIKLESGKYTTVNLIVGRNEIELGSVAIDDWTEGTTIDGGEALD